MVFSPSVNAAVRNIYGALLNGGSLHILPPLDLSPVGLGEELRSRCITVMHTFSGLFRRIAGTLGPNIRLESMRIVYLSGERITWNDFDEFLRVCPGELFLYLALGSTECQIHIHWFVDEKTRATYAHPPLGREIPDRTVKLMDENGPVADGEVGELVVASRYIGLGYWNAPELTRRTFTIDGSDPRARIFRTGDLGRWGPDGLLEYIGRKDEQIKLHGRRIHPAEIENALMALANVVDAAVVVRSNVDGMPRSLAAFVVLGPNVQGLLPRHLAAMLQKRLPRHLIPWPICVVDGLPRSSGLKIDRAQLAQMDAIRAKNESAGIESPMVAAVAKVFEQVLEVTGATPDDNVASLGGNSLQAVDIAAELERCFGVIVSDETMGSALTIQDLALWIADQHGR